MDIPRCFDLRGRIGRLSFALTQVPFVLVATLLVLASFGAADRPAHVPHLALVLLAVKPLLFVLVALMAPLLGYNLCQACKRAHDLGLSGYCCVIFLVPLFNILLYLYLLLAPGQKGGNVYGVRDCG